MTENEKPFKKYFLLLVLSSYLLYMLSTAVKMVYSAEIVEIAPYYGVDKSSVSLGLTIYYAAYAITQLFISVLMKKFDMRKFIVGSSIFSALSFGGIFFMSDLWQIWIILGFNGMLQAGIWGGTMYFFGRYLPDEMLSRSSAIMSTAYAVGNAMSFGSSALFVKILDWKYTFLFIAILFLLSAFLFGAVVKKLEKTVPPKERVAAKTETIAEKTISKKKLTLCVIYYCTLGFVVSCAYFAVSNWFPNLLKEVYNLPSSYSILLSLLIPVGMLFGPFLANGVADKTHKPALEGAIFMGVTSVIFFVCTFVYAVNIVLISALTLISMLLVRGYCNLIYSYVPLKARGAMESGRFSLLINSFASVSSAIMPYLSGLVLDHSGWEVYYYLCTGLCLLSLAILVFGMIAKTDDVLY